MAGQQGRRSMGRSRHVGQKPPPNRPVSPDRRPLGVQRLSRKTWDKVRQAIQQLERAVPAGQPMP
jgi:hypothetical protein